MNMQGRTHGGTFHTGSNADTAMCPDRSVELHVKVADFKLSVCTPLVGRSAADTALYERIKGRYDRIIEARGHYQEARVRLQDQAYDEAWFIFTELSDAYNDMSALMCHPVPA